MGVLQQQLTPDILRHLERALQASQHPTTDYAIYTPGLTG